MQRIPSSIEGVQRLASDVSNSMNLVNIVPAIKNGPLVLFACARSG